MTLTSSLKKRLIILVPIVAVSCFVITAIIVAGILVFFRSRSIMEQQLKDKLQSTAAAAVMQFDGETLDDIRTGDTLDSSAALRGVVQKLQKLRANITHVQFAYIMRRTDNPRLLEFVADADLALSPEELDRNHNGQLDSDEEPSSPGDTYDWAAFPFLGTDAFVRPTVDDHIGYDQWGPIISGYAPIFYRDGTVAGVLGIDMGAQEFIDLSNSIFSPVALLLTVLASLCLGAGSALFIWRRRLEALEQLEVGRSGLLRLAFHQLGGPLTIINWSLEELEDEGPESIQRIVVTIQEGVKRLDAILRTLKSADLVRSGKIEYKPEFGSLTSVLEQVVKESGTKLALRHQSIRLDLEENISMQLDPKLIAGVAQELIQNAMDFSPDGAEITVESRRRGKLAEFSVIDHGCGIPKNDLRKMFEEFARAANASKFKTDGNGLGLYIVKGVIEEARGHIAIASIEGEGTTVTVRLPIA